MCFLLLVININASGFENIKSDKIKAYLQSENDHFLSKIQDNTINDTKSELQGYNSRILSSTAAGEGETENSHFGSNQTTRFSNAQMICIFIFFGLLFGSLILEVNKKFGIPTTPVIILLSIGIGAINGKLGWIGETIQIMLQVDPHICLATFIVPIVFESAFDADVFVMKRNVWAIFMVSGPGSIITSL